MINEIVNDYLEYFKVDLAEQVMLQLLGLLLYTSIASCINIHCLQCHFDLKLLIVKAS
jgi:hypothetical protein